MTTSGWGAGEWSDMAWGTGVDYPYAAIERIRITGQLSNYSVTGQRTSLSTHGEYASSIPRTGVHAVNQAITGQLI